MRDERSVRRCSDLDGAVIVHALARQALTDRSLASSTFRMRAETASSPSVGMTGRAGLAGGCRPPDSSPNRYPELPYCQHFGLRCQGKLTIVRMTFAEKYCAKTGVHPTDYEATVFRHSLRPVARFLRFSLNLNSNYFAADREFIRGVGRISRLDEFQSEAVDFAHYSERQGFCHRTLKWRVSRESLRRIVRATLKE